MSGTNQRHTLPRYQKSRGNQNNKFTNNLDWLVIIIGDLTFFFRYIKSIRLRAYDNYSHTCKIVFIRNIKQYVTVDIVTAHILCGEKKS